MDRRNIKKQKMTKEGKSRITACKDQTCSLPDSHNQAQTLGGFAPTALPTSLCVFLGYVFFLGLISWRSTSCLGDAHRSNGARIPVD